jgi:antitoxin VapB
MGQQLNIKSDHAYTVANKLSEMTGQSLTTVVTMALDQLLEREERARGREARIRKLRKLTAEIRERLGDPLPSSDHSWLYDDNGLPR